MVQPGKQLTLPRLGEHGDPLPPYATVEQVLAHPRFALARNHYMRVMIDAHDADPAMHHLMSEMGRNVLFNIILGYYARRIPTIHRPGRASAPCATSSCPSV
jgi:hypothetical protein